jgi:NAD(P)-dependent dehydrogenase (short-subunit alcohol dehydrogenase family)
MRDLARIFVTGSADGLGLAAAQSLLADGHHVVLHARNEQRAAGLRDRLPGAEAALVGDLASRADTIELARRANELGTFDAVIHNAAVGSRERRRVARPEGHAHVLAINVLAPYVLTAEMNRPRRLVYLSSGMHRSGDSSLHDIDWTERRWNGPQAYSDSKLFDTALAFAVARRWPDVLSNSVSPGWVATKMGGPGATDDLSLGHVTQAWLAVSDDPDATVSGRLFYHQEEIEPAPAARDTRFQDALVDALAELTGVTLPA